MSEKVSNPAMMQRAIELAMCGRGTVEPNPMVGCVIVKDGRVIGEGFHAKYGGAHAEPTALANCTESPAGATAYVTLEPCCHVKKQTPPCVPRLIDAKISRVLVGALDPNPEVNGKGVQQLRQAGIEVLTGIMEPECRQLIAPFIATTQFHRPYITLKWAQDAAGKVAAAKGKPGKISNQASRRMVHALRGRSDAIVVGVNTVLTDDPLLTVRYAEAIRTPVRYVLDRRLRTPLQAQLVQTATQIPVVIATHKAHVNSKKATELRGLGAEIVSADTFTEVIADWQRRRLTHVLVEAGPTLARALMDENLADRVWIIRSPKIVGEADAPSAAMVPGYFRVAGEADVEGDRWTEYLYSRSEVFFADTASADFLLRVAAVGTHLD